MVQLAEHIFLQKNKKNFKKFLTRTRNNVYWVCKKVFFKRNWKRIL